MNHVQFSSQKVLEEAIHNMQYLIEENQAIVRYESLPLINAEYAQIVQLFQNLITNSIKYKFRDPPEIVIAAERTGDEWLFSVSDNGIGIENQYFERIFLLFQRLHNRMEYPGTGIGLSICKKIVEKHGGKIWVESTVNKGTNFFFTIPE